MSELPNFPFISQLDGSENSAFNCVPASIAACLQYLTGKSYTADQIKDAVYGTSWRDAGTDAANFVAFCRKEGAILSPVQAHDNAHAVMLAHTFIQRGTPVIFTQQDDYAPAGHSDWTHVCIWYKENGASLTAMDPFGAREIAYTDATWVKRLRSLTLWTMEKAMLDLSNPGVAGYFQEVSDQVWRCRQNGLIIGHGILDFYRRIPYGLAGLTDLGLPLTNESGIPGFTGVVMQRFERGVVVYDPGHKFDRPPGAGDCYKAHLYQGPGQDPRLAQMSNGQAAEYQKRLKQIHELSTI